jgi:putative ABC transport system permease protein
VADLVQDVRYGLRSLTRSPGFTLTAIACLGAAIGATSIMFGIVDALILRPPALVREPNQVVRIYVTRREGNLRTTAGGGLSYPDYRDLQAGTARAFTHVAAFAPIELDLGRGEGAERVVGTVVSSSYFATLGVQPIAGRFFAADEDSTNRSAAVVVIGYGLWRRRFGADPGIVGRNIVLAGRPFVVIGVAPERFTGAGPEPVDVWLPMMMAPAVGRDMLELRFASWLKVIGRLAPGVSQQQAADAATAALRHAAQDVEGLDKRPTVTLVPLSGAIDPARGKASAVSLLLLAATGVLLLIGCANVANLLLTRAARRRREIAVRIALGVTPWRLIKQLLAESVLLALAATAIGVIATLIGTRLAHVFSVPADTSLLNGRVVAFTVGISILTALIFGLAPALQISRSDPAAVLKASGPAVGSSWLSGGARLVIVQIALSLILVVAAGSLVRSLRNVVDVDTGLDIDRLLLVSINLEEAGYTADARQEFYVRALERLRSLPGVERASIGQTVPFREVTGIDIAVPGINPQPQPRRGPYVNYVGPEYLATIGTRLLRGREFTVMDGARAPRVAVINRAMADLYWPGMDPIGQCILFSRAQPNSTDARVRPGGDCTQVVGIATTGKYMQLQEDPIPFIYLPLEQHAQSADQTIVVRTSANPRVLASVVRRAIVTLAPNVPFVDVQPMAAVLRPQVLPYRLSASLFTSLGTIALGLALVGLYGLTAYTVAQRRHEIAVRIALGARSSQVLMLIMGRGLRLVLVGAVIGSPSAVIAMRLFSSQLYGVRPLDPASLAVSAALLGAAALVACYIPARRAARTDPVAALRAE